MMIDKEKFDVLLHSQEAHLVSIYLPTYRAGKVEEDRLRLKNALNEARDKLAHTGMNEKEARRYLESGYELLEDQDFFPHLSDGLALFFGADTFEKFILPITFNSFVYLGEQFFLRPLIPLVSKSPYRFFILALSQNEVRFFEADQYSITPVIIEDLVPKDRAEALGYDDTDRSSLQHHPGAGNADAIFHGHGMGKDQPEKEIAEYFRKVDDGLMQMLHDEDAPMILALVDYLAPIYREVTQYDHVVDFHVSGNPENNDPVLLHEKAWARMKTYFDRREAQERKFDELLAYQKASNDIKDILIGARDGRVEQLFIDKDEHLWGTIQTAENTVALHDDPKPGDVELLEWAARQTYFNGGTVFQYAQEALPDSRTHVNAIYRY